MAATIPTGLPIRAHAGDSWLFDLTYGGYPNTDGWVPAVHVRGAETIPWSPTWVATQGTGWRVTIPATATADLPAGTYTVACTLTGSGVTVGQVVTVDVVSCVVQANLATAAAGDQTVWEETMVATLRTAIQSLASGTVSSYMIGPRQVVYQDLPELRKMLGQFEAKLARRRNPGGLGQAVKMRFTEVSP
jgi:hypothetical protein